MKRFLGLSALAVLTACTPRVPPAPAPIPVPEITVEAPSFSIGRTFLLPPPVVEEEIDPILHSEWASPNVNGAGFRSICSGWPATLRW